MRFVVRARRAREIAFRKEGLVTLALEREVRIFLPEASVRSSSLTLTQMKQS